MARPRNQTPVYKLHSSTGLARCWVNGRWVSLGKYGSPESHAEFARIVAEHASVSIAAPRTQPESAFSVDELALAFLRHAEKHYRGADGKPTNEYREFKRAIAPLHELYGHTMATTFGPRALAVVRDQMVKTGWCRKLVNQRVGRVVRVFKWGASQELIPVTIFEALRTLPGLQRGRTEARESKPVKPVPVEHVTVTLPRLGRHVRAMVEFQLLTGCRPGEVCALRMADVDTSADVWLFRPTQHKNAHRGHDRVIVIGPKARAVLESFLLGCGVLATTDFFFSPRRAREERFRLARENRKSPVQPSHVSRRKAKPKLVPATEYTPHTYSHAVRVAAKKAQVPHWHPNQLRHTFATAVRKAHGLEAAQVLLGHAKADVTQTYAERNLALATTVASEIG
jgi:integrase